MVVKIERRGAVDDGRDARVLPKKLRALSKSRAGQRRKNDVD